MAGTEFSLAIYPWIYLAKFDDDGWNEQFVEKPHRSAEEEAAASPDELAELYRRRNSMESMPLVNYTTQYAMGCFEGLKAFPQPDGSLKLFRPRDNGLRMFRSMEGLMMPGYPADLFVAAVRGVMARNQELGFAPDYDPAWERNDFATGHAAYVRPFSYTEGGIGVNLSHNPWVVIVSTRVGSYFDAGVTTRASTTRRIRATPNGTGWIKCSANYVTSALAKKEVEAEGFMESIFLDATERCYVEEGSSCNIFFVLDSGVLVTPALEDTILPGITRSSVIELARDAGLTVEERRISIDEVFDSGVEAFGTGTAAGIQPFESITHDGRTVTFGDGTIGTTTRSLLVQLKGIQYGAIEDRFDWMVPVRDAHQNRRAS